MPAHLVAAGALVAAFHLRRKQRGSLSDLIIYDCSIA